MGEGIVAKMTANQDVDNNIITEATLCFHYLKFNNYDLFCVAYSLMIKTFLYYRNVKGFSWGSKRY